MLDDTWVFCASKSDISYIYCFMPVPSNNISQGARKIGVNEKAHYYTVGVGNGWKYSISIISVA